MKRSLSHGSIVSLVVFSSFLRFPQMGLSSQSSPRQELTLLVYTYTDLSTYQARKIRERVTFIYENAGIRINWLDCSQGAEGHQIQAACAHPLCPSDLVIRLLDQSGTSKVGSRMTPLGHSFVSGRGGSYGSVFFATVKELARGNRTSEIEILGHAIAHEIGHLLLGTEAHASAGIMKAQWKEKDFSEMLMTNGLLFSEQQAKSLKICLSARQKKAVGHQAASLNGLP